VLQNIFNQLEHLNEQQIHSSLATPRVEPSAEQLRIWQNFERYCQQRGIRAFPASPALVASFLDILSDEELEPACQAIQVICDSIGASSPVATLAVRTVLERRLRSESPRSWSRDDRALFASLPVEVRAVLARRENERDAALRTKQNQLAEERKQLRAGIHDKELKNE
jgi:sirohydrochlorin ferrochelatase